MRTQVVVIAAVVLGIASVIIQPASSALQVKTESDEQADHCRWLAERLDEANSIKEGMTRTDLLKTFVPDGGLQRLLPETYVLRSCSLIKVRVTFALPKGMSDKDATRLMPFGDTSQRDVAINSEIKIVSVSTPYLERAFMD